MLSLIGIFVITSSTCVVNNIYIPKNGIIEESLRGKLIVFNNKNIGENCSGLDSNGVKTKVNNSFEKIDGSKMCDKIKQFIRVSTSSDVSVGETARPVCDWIGCKWIVRVGSDDFVKIYEFQQCVYCDKKRIKKEVWEDVR